MKKTQTDWQKTRKATDYRTFLQAYLEESSWSLSDLARAAGFGRGFPGDVISGKRRLTAKSFAAFETALKLPVSGRKLFRYLVATEEQDLFPALKSVDLNASIRELRVKPWTRVRKHESTKNGNDVRMLFSNPHVFSVYAAAGTSDKSTSYETILERTRLPESDVKKALQGLMKAGLLKDEEGRYRSDDTHVFLKTKGKDEAFIRLFQAVSTQASRRVEKAIQSDDEMFFTSSFCVDEKRLPELKTALRRTMLQFVDEAIDADGGRVTQLVTAMFL